VVAPRYRVAACLGGSGGYFIDEWRFAVMGESIVYGARCVIDGKWYIGKTDRTLEDRIKEHERAASTNASDLFHKTMRDMGLKNFEWKELDKCPRDAILARERKWISDLAAQSIEVLNTAHTPKAHRPSGVIIKSRIQSKIAGARAWQRPSAKEWMQRSGKLLPCINLLTGEKFESLLAAERRGPDKRPGIRSSCETGRPTLNGNRYAYIDIEGNPVLKEGHKKALPRTRRVVNLNTGTIFDSLADAAKSSGASQKNIQACCRGAYKTASGMVFCYVGDNDEELLTETHQRYRAELEQRKNLAFAAWKIDDVERKHLVIADTAKRLAELIEINGSHILAICRGERQHDHGWRVAFYNKASKQIEVQKSHSAKVRKQIRKVICLDDNAIYSSFSGAAVHYGLSGGQIKQCCDGILKSTGRESKEGVPRRFAYVDDTGKAILTPKHREPFEMLGDICLFCPQTGKKYQSVAHCSRETGIPQKRIRRYLKDQSVDLAGLSLMPLSARDRSPRGTTQPTPEVKRTGR
jgi:hypothetical protein